MADTQLALDEPLFLRVTRLALQYCRFGCVGLLATGTHVIIFMALVWAMPEMPVMANFLAFCVAFSVSFSGHFAWTFGGDRSGQSRWEKVCILRRFVVVAVFGLALNTGAVILIADILLWPPAYATLPMMTIVPVATFLASKYWAFV